MSSLNLVHHASVFAHLCPKTLPALQFLQNHSCFGSRRYHSATLASSNFPGQDTQFTFNLITKVRQAFVQDLMHTLTS